MIVAIQLRLELVDARSDGGGRGEIQWSAFDASDLPCGNQLLVRHRIPLGNGILTVDTEVQALARARGGADGKGGDAVRACLSLVELMRTFEGQSA